MSARCENCFLEYDAGVCPHCGYEKGALAAEKVYLNPGTLLHERYAIGEVIGSGGFGIIYKAWDTQENQIVAIKEFFQSGLVTRASDLQQIQLVATNRAEEFETGKQRFLEEAVNTQKFAGHPNIVAVLDEFAQNNTRYYVMEFLQGETLNAYMEKYSLTLQEKIDIAQKTGDALKALHSAGILHRDISPDNIIIPHNYPEEDVKLFDFGAARFSRYEKESVQTRIMKPGYSPLEQYGSGSAQNEQIDIYALGATLYFLLTGIKPEESTNRRVEDTLPAPRSLNAEVPDDISNAILKAMALDLHLRFRTVDEFQAALTLKIKVLSPDEEMRIRRRKRRRIIRVATACILVGFAIIGIRFLLEIDRTTLPDASINLWYTITGDTADDSAKLAALTAIIEDFNGIYPNVSVALRGVDEAVYADEVGAFLRRGDYPAVFESSALSDELISVTLEISDVISSLERNSCNFLDNYSKYFPNKRQIPVGFHVSAIYANHSLSSYEGDGVSDIGELLSSMPFAVSDKGLSCQEAYSGNFKAVYGDHYALTQRSSFINDETGAYFSDTAEYYTILNEMPGRFKMLYVDSGAVPAEFGSLWSVMSGSRDEQKAAKRFLGFMLSDNAQHFLHISNQSGLLPLNRQTLDTYREVYVDYSQFFMNIDKYSFSSR